MALSRRHWRFVVRDQYGFVIQNAKVNVYQPGTSNAFLGSAFTADTGGSGATNPFTTNAQGEVEAWFDTAQVVDVQVDDNTDTAYRAVNGASATISFTTFVENDNIEVDPVDLPTTIGTTADLQDITAGAQSEVVGTSTRWAPGDHIHGHTALAADPHGEGQHTNVARTYILLAEMCTLGTGTAMLNTGAGLNLGRSIEYSDAASEDAFWTFALPSDYVSGTVTATIVFSPTTTDAVAHTIRWNFTAITSNSGDITAAGTATAWTGTSRAVTANLLYFEPATSIGVTPAAAGDYVKLNIQRIGADGADTLVSAVRVTHVIIGYTGTQ